MALTNLQGPALLRPEPELWSLAGEELADCGGVLDLALPKARAEVLACGFASTAHQRDKTACEVSLALGGLRKTLRVSGDRQWTPEHGCTPPLAFERMRLGWDLAYGGEGCADNPLGRGMPGAGEAPAGPQALPNIEYPQWPTRPGEEGRAAGFGPLQADWPCRLRLLGDGHAEMGGQGFAEDCDAGFFNMAPPDQRFDQDHLPPGAAFEIRNMHPSQACQQGRLPDWRARCLVLRQQDGEERCELLDLRPTTLWLFPHREQMVLVYHAAVPIAEDDAHDVLALMPALESAGQPRGLEHYQQVWRQRSDKERGALHAFRDADLLPAEALGAWFDTEVPAFEHPQFKRREAQRQQLQAQRQARVGERADMPADLPPSSLPPPRLDELPAFYDQVHAQAMALKSDALARAEAARQQPSAQHIQQAPEKGPEGIRRMRRLLEENAAAQPQQWSGERLAHSQDLLHRLYLRAALAQEAAERLPQEQARELREQVEERLRTTRDLSGLDLTGADLSGLDLRGACLRQALLEGADLSRCVLDAGDCREAMLARADLTGASLRGAQLEGASLAQAFGEGADFHEACLDGALFGEVRFQRCDFSAARLHSTELERVILIDCLFDGASLDNLAISEALLQGCRFQQAQLHKLTWRDCRLVDLDFSQASLAHCAWIGSPALRPDFSGASLRKCAFPQASLERAVFAGTLLEQCSFRGGQLAGAYFRHARLRLTDFSEACLRGADFDDCDASGCLFIRSDLGEASLLAADLIEALLGKARLPGADFSRANLFRADLSQVRLDGRTRFDGAYWARTRGVPPEVTRQEARA
ncbi:Uncharacterized protein YjbI, contains pentapeptide repeats [Pseudomonas delhiensis]|uniref:Uncharacterized protein YjbI, contains pentapeptide repeats n=2 Tax=Pseudomonas delhiensis TaxID=366289 RepID=A0A239IAI0_9PSED|nr:Uncharacterized protein YjbI, contains pentapeptide repeats [Pseudomonas delhiensis]SNS90585.1 Uncharacterized protein YjbI, contains pentapeptide repeats [Pseudomonas delhiensis]